MKFLIIFLFTSFVMNSAKANDLKIPGEKWIAKSSGYVCGAYGNKIQLNSAKKLKFKQITTDRTLDNGLLKASFIEGSGICNYSAIMYADNSAQTIALVESKAYAVRGESDCSKGKKFLDKILDFNKYHYWGHPHHLTIMVKDKNAHKHCGENSTHIGIDFTVTGRIQR